MKISYNDTILIEGFIQGTLEKHQQRDFRNKLTQSRMLRMKLHFQILTHKVVQLYHQDELKKELENLHLKIFNDPYKKGYQENIYELFQ